MTNAHSITFPEARAITLHYCEDFHTSHADSTPEDYALGLEQLTLKMSWFLGAKVPSSYLGDVLEVLEEFATYDSGDHPGLIQSVTGTIDEGGRVRDRLKATLNDQLYYVATSAGIRAKANELVAA